MWTNDIHQWIFRLINYPADFHALLPTMIDTIRMGVAHFGDEFNHIAVSAIYQTCMFNRNFCLDGSRLCNVISNTLKRTSDSQIGFRSFLLQALQKDFERKDFLVKSNCPDDRKVRYLHMIPFPGDRYFRASTRVEKSFRINKKFVTHSVTLVMA